jgi:hypothetical protein
MADDQGLTGTPRQLKWFEKKRWVILAGLVTGMGVAALLVDEPSDYVPLISPEPAVAADQSVAEDSATTSSAPESTAAGESTTSLTATTASPAGEDASEPGGPYQLVVLGIEDVSDGADGEDAREVDSDDEARNKEELKTVLKIARAELNEYPIEKARLRAALDLELEQFSGEVNAISFQILYDRREGSPPAFGTWVWAPEGDWSKADEGNVETWEGYEWSEPSGKKYESPSDCTPPNNTQLELSAAMAERRDSVPDESDDEAIEGLASEVNATPKRIEEMLEDLADWLDC